MAAPKSSLGKISGWACAQSGHNVAPPLPLTSYHLSDSRPN